jgi:hypothetical protein
VIVGWVTSLPTSEAGPPWPQLNTHLSWLSPPVMLVWGVASEALREIITGFLDEVRFE